MQTAWARASFPSAEAEIGRELLVEQFLGAAEREGRTGGELAGQGGGLGEELFLWDDPVVEADAMGLLGGNDVAGHEQLGGPAEAHHSGEQVGGAHVGAGEADLHEEKADLGGGGRDADVGSQRDGGACAGDGAVQGRDDGLAQRPHSGDHLAGEAGEGEQPGHVTLEELADDVDDVAAGAKALAGAGDHHGAHLGAPLERGEEVAQLLIDLEREGVELVGPVERHRGDALLLGVEEALGRDHESLSSAGRTAVASSSQSARSSRSAFTSTRVMAG